jgi:chromosome segregation protein
MRLERLEISGFKSFSDRSELAFDEGVTAIVGPNGCGKSNVADAITWVLGEQSARSLRGEKMEDVIFNGSDARKPGAAAEVRLRLSGLILPTAATLPAAASGNGHANGNGNGHSVLADAEETILEQARAFTRDVDVTRRLYRSGESEYLIDGEVCRLRDVHELLMDTGLGAKAYAIIEQGKIGMILSSRPTDRRQLIEEAAGITKYKSRRRAAELKLEAAQQNLTRVDDIVFEVEKQRGALKRQAAKARRYKRLREELRRWEKVLFARRYRDLARSIEAARARLAEEREREAAAAGHVATVESDHGRLRIEQTEADARAARIRADAHARELDINRRQQQQEFNRQQVETLLSRAADIGNEVRDLEARREPARVAVDARREAAVQAERARDEAAEVLTEASDEYARAQQQIEGLETDVEAARAEGFSTQNRITALRHAMEHAAAQRERVGETLGKLDVEEDDLRREVEKAETEGIAAADAHARAKESLERVTLARAAREAELASARAELEWRARTVRVREQELAGMEARLASLEELTASRREFGDAARMVLVQANGRVGQQGAVADYVDVDTRYERAVEAVLGDLLQHVIVERHEQAAAGLSLVRDQDAGRCGFVVVDPGSTGYHPREAFRRDGIVPIADVMRIGGTHATTIQQVLPDAYVADSFDRAVTFARETSAVVATLGGDVLRGPHLVSGGAKAESRGILATRREIKELRERIGAEREALGKLIDETGSLEIAIAQATTAIAALVAEQHREEKEIVGHQAQIARAADETGRLARKADVVALERRRAEEERSALESRYADAQSQVGSLQEDQRRVDERFTEAQRRLAAARESVDALSARAAEARAAHAALVERAAAVAAEVLRLEEAGRELEERVAARAAELEHTHARRESLLAAIADGTRTLDDDIGTLEALRMELRAADDESNELRAGVDAQDAVIREARRALEEIRAQASEFDVARATAESDLGHLAQSCVDAVQCSLDEVLAEVEQLEQAGETTPDAAAIQAEEPDPDAEEGEERAAAAEAVPARAATMTAEEAIVALKGKIDRLGPVNMMAIEQFDELETRHVFLTTQRKDLVDSIAQTSEAIRRIDETTRVRFTEAFTAIQQNFQVTFSTLFGGGRAGLTLLDENDPLESGIDIVASPPGKRLQNVQLLSGGEKALTAIALMFAIFRYKPSPFCLLDEIDAPLDDANVSRFVEMLRGMLDRTQFILITHNRRTMEIANRLYGVTMEEPGVSKLISVQLN